MKIARMIAAAIALNIAAPTYARIVPAWTASQQPTWGSDFLFPTNIPPKLANRTLRQVVQLAIGGKDVRIVLSNAFGSRPVTIASAHAAPSLGNSRVAVRADRQILFAGATAATIAPGATIVSDPLPLRVAANQDLAVSLLFKEAPVIESFHWDGRRTAYVFEGDQLTVADPRAVGTTTARLLLTGVLVDSTNAQGTVVVMGDSITDGAAAKLDADTRWPDFLAMRAAPRGIAVVNAGISGARLLYNGMGSNALARMDRDVLAQPNVHTLILMLGTNDIAWPGTPFDPHTSATAFEEMVTGYRAVVARAHAAGIRVIGATLPPFADALPGTPLAATYYSPAKDTMRQRVNKWIRSSGTFDGIVDFDRVLRDPKEPTHLAAQYDSGDHLHPGDAGNKAMAEAIDLETLIVR